VGKECQVKVDTETWLGPNKTGGIEILAQKGKIKVDNTLEARLAMVSHQILPSMRNKLFGANPSRFGPFKTNQYDLQISQILAFLHQEILRLDLQPQSDGTRTSQTLHRSSSSTDLIISFTHQRNCIVCIRGIYGRPTQCRRFKVEPENV
jgi:hypothetical protein